MFVELSAGGVHYSTGDSADRYESDSEDSLHRLIGILLAG